MSAQGTPCTECGGKGAVPTGECREAMSGPTCLRSDCPPCQTPETDTCERCKGTGTDPDHKAGEWPDLEMVRRTSDHRRFYARDEPLIPEVRAAYEADPNLEVETYVPRSQLDAAQQREARLREAARLAISKLDDAKSEETVYGDDFEALAEEARGILVDALAGEAQ